MLAAAADVPHGLSQQVEALLVGQACRLQPFMLAVQPDHSRLVCRLR